MLDHNANAEVSPPSSDYCGINMVMAGDTTAFVDIAAACKCPKSTS